MVDHATLFLARVAGPPDLLAATGGRARLTATNERGVLLANWEDVSIRVELLSDAEAEQYLGELRSWAEESGNPAAEPLAAAQQVLDLQVYPAFDEAGTWRSFVEATLERQGGVYRIDPGSIFDASGACLFEPQPEAGEAEEEEPPPADLPPPSPGRVARRALVLAAVALRAFLERDRDPRRSGLQARLLSWLEEQEIDSELEEEEAILLSSPAGSLEPQAIADASWHSEGLAVLAWALEVTLMPAHDTQVDPETLARELGLLSDKPGILRESTLRPVEELAWAHRRLLGIHWRLTALTRQPAAIDFGTFAQNCWFGPFDLEGLPLSKDDLALRGKTALEADEEVRLECRSIAQERYRAIDWLLGAAERYSDVNVDT